MLWDRRASAGIGELGTWARLLERIVSDSNLEPAEHEGRGAGSGGNGRREGGGRLEERLAEVGDLRQSAPQIGG
eukprot:3006015-Rhodomonas_salina.1